MRSRVRSSLTAPLKYAYRRVRKPELSVIIPAYNAEATIERAVRSVLSQGVQAVEVIVVDDMSTDGTRATVSRMAAKDPRIKLLSSGSNGGPGRARNIGVARARGEYLTFVDADDRVLPHAYKRMLETLKETGSDFISGGYRREGRSGGYRPEVTQRVHSKTILRTNLEQFAGVLEEPVLWNKIYRSGFWNKKAGPIPEDRNYEDQEPALRAALEARSFDVVDYDVYAWRTADGRETRSQSKRTIADLESRIAVVRELLSIADLMPADAKTVLQATVLGRDLGMYFEQVPYTGEDYWALLQPFAAEVWERVSLETTLSIPVALRLLAYVSAYSTREDVDTLVGAFEEYGRSFSWEHSGDTWYASTPYLDELAASVPSYVLERGPSDWLVKTCTWSAKWTADGVLVLSGYAYIPGLNANAWSGRTIELRDQDEVLWSSELPGEFSDWVDVEASDPWTTYNDTMFRANIPMPDGLFNDLSVHVVISVGSESFDSQLRYATTEPNPQRLAQPTCQLVATSSDSGILVSCLPSSQDGSPKRSVTSSPSRSVVLKSASVENEVLMLRGSCPVVIGEGALQMRLVRSDAFIGLPTGRSADGNWVAEVDLGDPQIPSSGMFLEWTLQADSPNEVTEWQYVQPSEAFAERMPVRYVGSKRSATISRLYGIRTGITLGPPLSNLERSRFGQRQLQTASEPRLSECAVFDSYAGKSAGDNPLAVLEQMDDGTMSESLKELLPEECDRWPRYWSVIDGTHWVPDGVTPLYVGSKEWFETVRSARLLVTNSHLPAHVVPQPGQFWLQTWHGTPLKRLLLDAPRGTTSALYRRTMAQQVPHWSLLLAQDAQAERDLRSSVLYTGKTLVEEYPRNARLFLPGLRQETRHRLGIGPKDVVILYAPTWRKSDTVSLRRPDYFLDPSMLARRTGATVLVRAHHMASIESQSGSGVIDVSTERRVEDLMVASDILVSDYSSIFYDYQLLGRPMIAYVPDLERYGENERGFYREWPVATVRVGW